MIADQSYLRLFAPYVDKVVHIFHVSVHSHRSQLLKSLTYIPDSYTVASFPDDISPLSFLAFSASFTLSLGLGFMFAVLMPTELIMSRIRGTKLVLVLFTYFLLIFLFWEGSVRITEPSALATDEF